MASNSSATTLHSPTYGSDPTTPNTTFVQADPSNFRAVVQKLTGASEDPSAQKLPLTIPSRLAAQAQAQAQAHRPPTTTATEIIGPKKPNFKLHERRAKKLELNIGVSERPMMFPNHNNSSSNMVMSVSPSSSYIRSRALMMGGGGGGESMVMASPVSPLEVLARGSPRTPKSPVNEEEEERAIAEKGFYLHPSPLSTPRASQPPELLPLFPLHSPNHNHTHSSPSPYS